MACATFVPPFLLIAPDGGVELIEDWSSLGMRCLALRVSQERYGPRHWTADGWVLIAPPDWIVRDLYGRIVDPGAVDDAKPPCPWRRSREAKRLAARHAAELGLPIPGTGKRERWFGTHFRFPRHMGAERAAVAAENDDREDGIHAGNIPVPPNAWDDILRSDLKERNWKRHRQTRWRKASLSYRQIGFDLTG
jgi:hypothetical protein